MSSGKGNYNAYVLSDYLTNLSDLSFYFFNFRKSSFGLSQLINIFSFYLEKIVSTCMALNRAPRLNVQRIAPVKQPWTVDYLFTGVLIIRFDNTSGGPAGPSLNHARVFTVRSFDRTAQTFVRNRYRSGRVCTTTVVIPNIRSWRHTSPAHVVGNNSYETGQLAPG